MNMNITNLTNEEKLKIWNEEIFKYLVFDVVIHCLYLSFGIVGNMVVIYVYLRKIKGKENNRYFIPVLAAVDLMACICGSGFAITLDSLYVIYPSKVLCKLLWSLCMFTTQTSVLLLLVISVQRYLLICKPHGGQMTQLWKRIALVLVIGVAAILTFPVAIFFGEKHVTNQVLNVTGVQCYIQDEYTNSKYLLVYNMSLLLLAVIGTTSFTTLYFLIGKKIYQKELQKRMKLKKNLQTAPCYSVTDISGTVENILNDTNLSTLQYKSTFYLPTPLTGSDSDINSYGTLGNSQKETTLTIRHKLELKKRMKQRVDARRFTWLFMTISIVFVLTFTPRLILVLVESLDTEFWEHVSDFQRLIYTIIYRIYIIYHITNPIIYGFQDTDFKKVYQTLFCTWKNKIKPNM